MAKKKRTSSRPRINKPIRSANRQSATAKTAGRAAKSKKAVKAARRPARKTTLKKVVSVGAQIVALEKSILKSKEKLVALRRTAAPVEIADHTFKAHDGSEVRLSEMFGARRELIMVHNMGKQCRWCTLWADGFVGLTKHLENRAAFVVVSKDDVDTQRAFYQSRGWNFRMYSSFGTTFNRDVRFEADDGHQMPGVSAFFKDESGKIFRAAYTYFGPGDDFCAVWPMLDLLRDGLAGWEPQYQY